MLPFRALALRRPGVVALLLAAAMLLRLLVPAGFMPMVQDGAIALAICQGSGPPLVSPATHGMKHHGEAPVKTSEGCAFADLALPLLGGAPPVLLAALLLLAFAVALHFRAQPPSRAAPRLRPPLRGPPLIG